MEVPSKSSPLLRLPAELRLIIYTFIGPPGEIFPFTRLLRTCKIIHNEVKEELSKDIQKNVAKIANAIRSVGDDIQYTAPATLFGWLHLTVSRPKRSNMWHPQDPYFRFLALPLNALTITFHDDIRFQQQGTDYVDPGNGDFLPVRSGTSAIAREVCYWDKAGRPRALRRLNLDRGDLDILQRSAGRFCQARRGAWILELEHSTRGALRAASFYMYFKGTKMQHWARGGVEEMFSVLL